MIIERDKKNLKLQQEVFGKLNDIINTIDPVEELKSENNVQFVDVEAAARELLKMGIKG